MVRFLRIKLILVFIALAIFSSNTKAQTGICANPNNQCKPVPISWGYYNWQVDQGTLTTTLKTEYGYTNAPPGGGYSTSLTLLAARTIHEVHGIVAFTVWSQPGCSTGTIIAEVRTQTGESIASVYLQNLATNSVINLPIKGTFPSGLALSGLQLNSFNSQCGAVTLSWALVMN
jgi:hypothetical protein